jgi:subtilisin family serine protease
MLMAGRGAGGGVGVAGPQIRQQNVMEDRFPHAALIVPRVEPEEEGDVTFTPAAMRRAMFRTKMELRTPSKNAANVLQRIGLDDAEKLQAVHEPASKAGVFTRLNALGATAAFFGREDLEDSAREELDDQYEIVPDFPLSLPTRVQLGDVPVTRGQSTLNDTEWPEVSGVAQAHELKIRGDGTLIGMLDTGVDADHQEFVHQMVTYRYVSLYPNSPYWPSRDVRGFDTDGHGTHVCGIAAGHGVGVAPEAGLYVASVIESETTRTAMTRVANGLDWILRQFTRPENDHRPAVLNMSLGFRAEVPPDIRREDFDRRLRLMRTLLRTLVQANVLPVVAIGNDGPGQYSFPGAFDEVVGVGAVDFGGVVGNFSGSGQLDGNAKPDLVGYGVGVYSSIERDYNGGSFYERANGTSMATPYVTGIAALYRCQHPYLTVPQVWDLLLTNAYPLPSQNPNRVGAGIARFIP